MRLRNFRAYADTEIVFNPHFNVIMGNNGMGKTAILEALTVAIGSFFLGIDYAENRGIQPDDIRITNTEYDLNEQFPVEIEAWGTLDGQDLTWLRELTGPKNKTTFAKATDIKNKAKNLQERVRAGENVDLPLLVYYSTERLWKERKEHLEASKIKGSRLQDGYYNGLQATSNNKFFTRWFEREETIILQRRADSVGLDVVRGAVSKCIMGCNGIYFDFNIKEVVLEFEDGRKLPFQYLSDGVRNMLAMVADIALRCVLLNPHLRLEACNATKGIVLIDELDLHLHPAWQVQVAQNLRETFPNLQFITSTHSPLILSSTKEGVITLHEGKAYNSVNTYGRTASDILKNAMQVPDRPVFVQQLLDDYFELIDANEGSAENGVALRQQLETIIGHDDAELARADIILNFKEFGLDDF